LSDFYNYAKANPGAAFVITSGDRTHQPNSSPYPIAKEGSSFHERWAYHQTADEAIDVWVSGVGPLAEYAYSHPLANYGLHIPFANDPVHTELNEYTG